MELALGTVQFGIGYGIAGRSEPVSEPEVRRILASAWERGVRRLDTAPAYGDIEGRLLSLCGGRRFEIVSKIATVPPGLSEVEACAHVRASIASSMHALGDGLRGLIFHNQTDVTGAHGRAIWCTAAKEAQAAGLSIGISQYGPGDVVVPPDTPQAEMLQFPGNAFDQRVAGWQPDGPKAEVSLRSAFLQGLLLMSANEAEAKVPAAASAMRRWNAWCGALELSQLRAALSIVKGFSAVSYCLIGVDGLDQFEEIVEEWHRAQPIAAPELACDSLAIIDPRQWRS